MNFCDGAPMVGFGSWKALVRWKGQVSPAISTIHQARAPFLGAIASAAALAFLPQAHEIYRRLALDPGGQAGTLFWTLSAVFLLIGGLWLLVLTLATGAGRFRRVFAAGCGAIPLLGAFYWLRLASAATLVYGRGQPAGVLDPTIAAPQAEAIDSINGTIRTNSCVSCSIVYRLSGTTAPMGQACAKPVP